MEQDVRATKLYWAVFTRKVISAGENIGNSAAGRQVLWLCRLDTVHFLAKILPIKCTLSATPWNLLLLAEVTTTVNPQQGSCTNAPTAARPILKSQCIPGSRGRNLQYHAFHDSIASCS
ncbi:uncharacterized protein LOC144104021 isoform X1 [Amblyomma americanum]